MKKLTVIFNRILNFLTHGVWSMRLRDLSGSKYFLIRQLRIYVLTVKGFYEDKCQLRASALTFYSVLSVVPVLAMAFGIAKGFGAEKLIQKELAKSFTGQEQVLSWLIEFADKMLDNSKEAYIAGLGFIILFWSVIKVLSNIEESFNDVWRIKKARTWGRKFSDYTAFMIFAPILLIGSSATTVVLKTKLSELTTNGSVIETISPFLSFLLNFTPYFLVWILFTLLYTFMPNTHVKFKSGLIAGIIAGTIYQVFQIGYIEFQSIVTSYNVIYGSFAALPLFLIWMQLSWLVVLLGAEISFAEQNVGNYEFEAESSKMSYDYKRLLNLYVLNLIVKNFIQGGTPLTSQNISFQLEIPIRIVREIIFKLINVGLISELVTNTDKEMAYQPAFDTNQMSVDRVIQIMETKGISTIPILENESFNHLKKVLDRYRNSAEENSRILLKDI